MKGVLKSRGGFTLIEMAIVLVIIGLLLGAILKGQAMIENAKVKRLKSDINSIVAATYSYQDRYGFLPGDDPTDRTSDLGATGCTGGNGDGLFNRNIEYPCFWQELIGAGFISGDASVHNELNVAKRNPWGAIYYIRSGTRNNMSGNYIQTNVPRKIAESLDIKYDDGKYNSGNIQANHAYNSSYSTVTIYWFAF